MNGPTLIALTLAAGLAAGCGPDAKPAARLASTQPVASDASSKPAAKPARQDTASPSSGSVHIDDRIIAACGNIPLAHFAFDSARIQADAASALDALARCFVSGKLAGRGMKLIGHTDQRGETEYNLALGQRRAGSVSSFLSGRGMTKDHLTSSSRGEFDATGTDEDGWARDRKVDVLLAE